MDIVELINEGRINRLLQVRNRLIFEGAVVHVTQHAPGREQLFLEDADFLYMLHLIKKKAKEFFLTIYSFVLMPSHLHILFRLNKTNLSEAMKSLFENYAKFFNKKYERKGHVFCGRFRNALCLDDNYLLAISLYIHLNPLKAGLIEKSSEYRWSSCSLYTQPQNRKSFVDYQFILKILDENVDKASRIYEDMIEKASSVEMGNIFVNPKAIYSFVLKLKGILPYIFKQRQELNILGNEKLENALEEFADKRRLRSPHKLEARRYLIEQLRSNGYSIIDIARKLGLSRQSIYKILS